MTISANSAGVVSGKFTIPASVPIGTKLVEFAGSGGSNGSANFTGTNEIKTTTQRKITVTNYWDPLAQTFTLDNDSQISGVDLWMTAKGTTPVVVQLREVENGFPVRRILSEAIVKPVDIVTSGGTTRFAFPELPYLRANTEYAIVVLCDDADAAASVAQLGKWDTTHGRWITSQPYQIGVLLSSSNASTWTAHQDMDLAFRLLSPSFTQTTRTIDLGTTAVSNTSDLMVMADVDIPSSSCRCVFRLTLIGRDNEAITVAPYQPISLTSRYTGNVKIEAILTGTADASPVLYPEVQLAVGNVEETAVYVTRTFSANSGTSLVVILDAMTPGSSTIGVEVFNGTSWSAVSFDSGAPLEDTWVERKYTKTGFSGTDARLRITMTGNAAARPTIRNLRAIFT